MRPGEPFPDLGRPGPLSLKELQAARKLLKQGLDLDRQAARRIVDHAIDLTVRFSPVVHAEECGWWKGAGCDHDCRRSE